MLPRHQVVGTIATYIIFVLDAHFFQFLVQLFMAGHRACFVSTCTEEQVVNLVVDVLVVQGRSFLDVYGKGYKRTECLQD